MLVGINRGIAPLSALAPALHLSPKSMYGPCDEARALLKAGQAVRYTEEFAPVWFGRRCIGSVYGFRDGRVLATTQNLMDLAGFPQGYVDVLTAIRNGKSALGTFFLNCLQGSSANAWSDMWPVASDFATAYSGTALAARKFADTNAGAIYHGGNVTPAIKFLTNYRICAVSAQTPGDVLWLYDRVLAYDECTIANSTQTMDNSQTAQRWVGSGLPGLRHCITVSKTGTGITASNFTTITYANEVPTGSRTVPTTRTLAITTSANGGLNNLPTSVLLLEASVADAGPFVPLQVGDIGVSSVTSYICSAANTGTMCHALIRPLAMVIMPPTGIGVSSDMLRDRVLLPRIYDGACISSLLYTDTGGETGILSGTLEFAFN